MIGERFDGCFSYGSFATGTRPAVGLAMSASAPEADVKLGYCHRPRWPFAVGGIARRVIQAPKPELRIMRYELNDHEWAAIKPFLPNKPRGVPRVNDRRVLNGIFWGATCLTTLVRTRL